MQRSWELGAPGVFMVEVTLVDDSTGSVNRYDLDKISSVYANSGRATK